MKRKNLVAVLLLITVVLSLAGCNYVSRPIGAGNNSIDNSGMLGVLMQKPNKTVTTQTTITQITKPAPEPPPADEVPDEPEEKVPTSPFDVTEDVFSKIEELLGQVSADVVDSKTATGVSDDLMKGRSITVFTPYDISGKDAEMMKAIANKLNMTVHHKQVNLTGAAYSAYVKSQVLSGVDADLMYVDQNTWGDIQYYAQPITSFVNFELGDKLGSFYGAMSENFSISDAFYESEKINSDLYVAAGIGAPYLLAYNKSNLVSKGTLAGYTDEESFLTYKDVKLADPVKMYKDGTWGLKAMQQMLVNSSTAARAGLATVKDVKSNSAWWFGSDNVPGFKLNVYTKAAVLATEADYTSVAGLSRFTVDTIQDLYWSGLGVGKRNVAEFINEADKNTAITKLFNTYIGADKTTSYAMLGIEATDLPAVAAAAGDNKWDFVAYPYGTIAENIIRTTDPNEEGDYLYENGEDILNRRYAGWAGGFAVLDHCGNPSVALRFAEDYTVAWQKNYESSFADVMSEEQAARYKDMKKNMGVTFYTSMMSHVSEMGEANPGAASKVSSTALSAMAEFAATPELFTQAIYEKNTAIGSYDPGTHKKWSDYITYADDAGQMLRADGMCAAYELARVMFNY